MKIPGLVEKNRIMFRVDGSVLVNEKVFPPFSIQAELLRGLVGGDAVLGRPQSPPPPETVVELRVASIDRETRTVTMERVGPDPRTEAERREDAAIECSNMWGEGPEAFR